MEAANNITMDLIDEDDDNFDPIHDIIDFLVRSAKISFKNSHTNEKDLKTVEKASYAFGMYQKSPLQFLLQFGKYFSRNHLTYFESSFHYKADKEFRDCVDHLKVYHSEEIKNKRVRNRRYKALKKLQDESDYFSEKQMMFRNPLLYEQLIGQYLTDDEIQERDAVDNDNLTLLTLILDTVDRNEMREIKNKQILVEESVNKSNDGQQTVGRSTTNKHWGDFDVPDTIESTQENRKQTMIGANERNLLREEFLNEMYNSFIDGRDFEFDYSTIDNNEDYDDLEQISQDAQDRYFDSEPNDSETLEQHMALVHEYGTQADKQDNGDDPLDTFMNHITKINNR
ncbi:coiled-coil domain-containing protein 97 [Leptidea sinapis]|uniref:coiled-coil domain-containing protein 97 n=1 Tax=Leptidea sinapis TaxID=189913 RepID=UPI002124CCB8|nr:coiled-coil domain-containing protein 97 [Leptidea sinapis]XP_050673976.1 coiled-coil domain-containing protein 97 [Leptidea sinapis]XP_050673977.1 coiled-coil domain-containing protein 97 [Leptidea sinapis]